MAAVRALLLLLAVALGAPSGAQVCQPDPAAVGAVWPPPWTPSAPAFNLDTVCIDLPYEQTITITVPSTVFVDGLGTVAVDSLDVAMTGAIANVPSGMQYSCNPATCSFVPDTPGCILLHGTPDATNAAPDFRDLVTTAQLVHSGGATFPFSVPRHFVDMSHYYVLVRTAAVCMGPSTSSTTTSTTNVGGTTLTSGASTTFPGGSTVTTTTLPIDCSLVPIRDTYPSLACELAALREAVSAEPSLVDVAERLRASLEKAAGHVQRSADGCRKGRAAKARRNLRRAVAPLKQFARRLRPRAARDVPDLVRERLMRDSETLQTNLRSLAGRVACPDDADAG
jgi:hypothetical protein